MRVLAAVLLALAAAGAAAQSLESAVMPGGVIEGHVKWEGDCGKCHVRFDRGAQTRLCLDCHKEVAADVRAGTGFHGRKTEQACRACHTEHKGREARIAAIDEKAFDHRLTDFTLRGAHGKVECASYHVAGRKFRQAPQACGACHRKDDKHRGALGEACADCHGETTWKEVRFDHARTAFPLRERHIGVPCKDCHADPRFKGAPTACNACHAKDDTHKGRFGTRCESCHGERGWKPALFDHARDAHYALRGRHAQVRCESCHRAPLHTEKLPQACVACHRSGDAHKGALGPKCESCHAEASWKKASFNHDGTKFPLRGRHARVECAACHKGPAATALLAKDCYGCHRADDQSKGHRGRYGEKCASCHGEQAWKPVRFDHARDTRYPLRGKHAAVRCDTCHSGVLYRDKLETSCASCHGGAKDPHRGQLGARCESCHAEQAWKPARFDHNASRFPLLGRHAAVQCAACHTSPRYRDASRECYACHEKKDVHQRRFGTRCETCHNVRDWRAWDFDHAKTRYPLDGAHRKADCLACHRTPVSGPLRLDTACASCHARDDVHGGQFGLRCERCHVTSSFREVKPSMQR